MHFSTLFTAFAVIATGLTVQATFTASSESITSALGLTSANHYGAPIAPWKVNHKPGWFYSYDQGFGPQGVLGINDLLCSILDLFLGPFYFHCPHVGGGGGGYTPPTPYAPVNDLTCFAQDDNSYLTYGLVDIVSDCQAMCDGILGCLFINTYHDEEFNDQLTCALFSKHLPICGDQPGLGSITGSYAYYK